MATIKFRRGTKANLPTLAEGEPGFCTDTKQLYVGDGTSNSEIGGAAEKLKTARQIDGVTFDGSADVAHYGVCSTAAATAAKTAAITGFALATGAACKVKFTITNSAASPTLNVNGTGAKAIWYKGAAVTAAYLAANTTFELVYNGTQYEITGTIDTNTTYTAMTQAEADTGTATTARSITAKVLADWIAGKTGNAAGKIVAAGTDGKIDQSLIPHQAITDVFPVDSQAAMLALSTAHPGDVAIRTDVNESYILQTAPASILANWQKLATPQAPVTSVAGKTGAVTLTASDAGLDDAMIATKVRAVVLTGLSTATNAAVAAADTVLAAFGKLQAQINAKAALASPALTGTPTAPTATAGTNTTQLATTAFVQAAIATVDGGTF